MKIKSIFLLDSNWQINDSGDIQAQHRIAVCCKMAAAVAMLCFSLNWEVIFLLITVFDHEFSWETQLLISSRSPIPFKPNLFDRDIWNCRLSLIIFTHNKEGLGGTKISFPIKQNFCLIRFGLSVLHCIKTDIKRNNYISKHWSGWHPCKNGVIFVVSWFAWHQNEGKFAQPKNYGQTVLCACEVQIVHNI